MRYLHHKRSPLPLLRMHGNIPLMQADDFLRQRHADAVSFHNLFLTAPIEEREEVLLVCLRHAHATIGEAEDGPFVPIGNLDEGSMVGRILAVVLNQVGEGDGEQVEVATDGDQAVVLRLLLFKEQVDAVVGMGTEEALADIKQ